MVELRALKSFTYAHHAVRAGETFAASETDAKILVLTKRAVRVEAQKAPARRPEPAPAPPAPVAPPVEAPPEEPEEAEPEPEPAPSDEPAEATVRRTTPRSSVTRRPPARRTPVGR